MASPPAALDQALACSLDEVIQTRGLSKTYPHGLRAVDSLNLTVRAGEIFGLLGPNGAGKTTTVGMLSTRVVPSAGWACVGGVDVVRDPALGKQVIGVVAQTNTLDRSLTVWENLYFHCRYFGMSNAEARARASELLKQFHLADRAGVDVSTLSGGMAQRLMVARGIAHHPHILFLDEPTAGLDPQSRLALWEILEGLRGVTNLTVLLTTHYMEEADALCDRVAIMDRGRILALGTPAELKASVGAGTVVHVSTDGDVAALGEALRGLGEGIRIETKEQTVTAYLTGSDGDVARIAERSAAAGFRVTRLTVSEPTLETVFITLTGKELRE